MVSPNSTIPELAAFAVLIIISAYYLSIKIYPVIIHISKVRKLMDEPVERSSHSSATPTLGGVGLFITFTIISIILVIVSAVIQEDLTRFLTIIAASIIMLFLGVKDDLLVLSPKKKIIGQIIGALLIVALADVRIENLGGVLGIGLLPYWASVFLSLAFILFIVNAYNLIDGIDGLAAGIAIFICINFGLYFFVNKQILLTIIAFVLIGALIGFLKYNLSKKTKLFMGDSGSMFVGLLLAYLAINFLILDADPATSFTLPNAIIVILAILSFPILDTLRVFIIRLSKKRSPFAADKNHIHHRLIDSGLTHGQACLKMVVANLYIVIIAFLVRDLYVNFQLYIIVISSPILYLLPIFLVRREGKLKILVPEF